MEKTIQILIYEGKLLRKNKLLLLPSILYLFWWIYNILVYAQTDLKTKTLGSLYYETFNISILYLLLVLGFFSIHVLLKDRLNGFETLIMTTPVKNKEWLFSKWIIAQILVVSYTLLTTVIQVSYFILNDYTFNELLPHTIYTFIVMGSALFAFTSLCFLAGVLSKGITSYIFLPVIWLLIVFLELNADNPETNHFILMFLPYFRDYYISPFHSIFELNNIYSNIINHQVIMIIFGFIFFFLSCLFFYPDRNTKPEVKSISLKLLISTILTTSLVVWSSIAYNELPIMNEVETNLAVTEKTDSIKVEEIAITLGIKDDSYIDSKSVIVLKNIGTRSVNNIPVALSERLNIDKIHIGKENTNWNRKGNIINLHLSKSLKSEEIISVQIHYSGPIDSYKQNGKLKSAFVNNGKSIFLPFEANWYPNLVDYRGRTQFLLKINGLRNVDYVVPLNEKNDNTYQGEATNLTIVGGNLRKQEFKGIKLVAHPDIFGASKKVIEKNLDGWVYVSSLLKEDLVPKAIYVLDSSYKHNILSDNDVLILSEEDLSFSERANSAEFVHELLANKFSLLDPNTVVLSDLILWTISKKLDENTVPNFKDFYKSKHLGLTTIEEKAVNSISELVNVKSLNNEELVQYLYEKYKTSEKFDINKSLSKFKSN
jgi:ABC-2 family transporter protein